MIQEIASVVTTAERYGNIAQHHSQNGHGKARAKLTARAFFMYI
jgi:hypothetical protein